MATNFLQQPTNNPADYEMKISKMYPDVYRVLMPYIDNAVDSLGQHHDLNDEQLNALTYQVMRNSSVMNQLPYGYNETTIADMVKVLLLSAIIAKYQDDPPYYPFAYPGYPNVYPSYPAPYPYPYPYAYPYAEYPYSILSLLPLVLSGGRYSGGDRDYRGRGYRR